MNTDERDSSNKFHSGRIQAKGCLWLAHIRPEGGTNTEMEVRDDERLKLIQLCLHFFTLLLLSFVPSKASGVFLDFYPLLERPVVISDLGEETRSLPSSFTFAFALAQIVGRPGVGGSSLSVHTYIYSRYISDTLGERRFFVHDRTGLVWDRLGKLRWIDVDSLNIESACRVFEIRSTSFAIQRRISF